MWAMGAVGLDKLSGGASVHAGWVLHVVMPMVSCAGSASASTVTHTVAAWAVVLGLDDLSGLGDVVMRGWDDGVLLVVVVAALLVRWGRALCVMAGLVLGVVLAVLGVGLGLWVLPPVLGSPVVLMVVSLGIAVLVDLAVIAITNLNLMLQSALRYSGMVGHKLVGLLYGAWTCVGVGAHKLVGGVGVLIGARGLG
jgi:hypothetical protein